MREESIKHKNQRTVEKKKRSPSGISIVIAAAKRVGVLSYSLDINGPR